MCEETFSDTIMAISEIVKKRPHVLALYDGIYLTNRALHKNNR
jgi:predicted methyltransferase